MLQRRAELRFALVHSGYQVVAEGRKGVERYLNEGETFLHYSKHDFSITTRGPVSEEADPGSAYRTPIAASPHPVSGFMSYTDFSCIFVEMLRSDLQK